MRATEGGGGTTTVRAEPNVAPMIDVMLVLLIIFMVITPAIATGLSAVPPRGENLRAHPEEPGDQTLGIDRRGAYFLNREPIRREELPGRLRELFSARSDDRVLYVVADRELEYRQVIDALGVAAASGVRVVGMVSERRRDDVGNGGRENAVPQGGVRP